MTALLVRMSAAQAPPMVVTIAGEIDIATAPALRRHLSAVPDCHTVLTLSEVRLLSAAGVTELVDLRDRLHRSGARLAIADAPRHVRKVLTITGLDDTVVLADTVDDAVRLVIADTPHACDLAREASRSTRQPRFHAVWPRYPASWRPNDPDAAQPQAQGRARLTT